jgi:hypothetical protein
MNIILPKLSTKSFLSVLPFLIIVALLLIITKEQNDKISNLETLLLIEEGKTEEIQKKYNSISSQLYDIEMKVEDHEDRIYELE